MPGTSSARPATSHNRPRHPSDPSAPRFRGRVRRVPGGGVVTLMTAHKILIAAAILFFLGYAIWELRNAQAGGLWALARGGISVVVAVGFLIYFRSLGRT